MTSGSVTDDNTPLIKGTGAEAGNTITVYNGNTVIGTATVQGDGTWSLQVNTVLADGTYRLTAKETDKVGNETAASPEYVIQIDAGGQPLPPTLTSVVDDVATYTGALQSNAVTNDNTLTLTGTAEANVTVKIYGGVNGTTLLGSTTADANGDWTYTTSALSDGLNTFVAEAVNSIGQVSPQTGGFPVTVDTAAPGAVSSFVVTDDLAPQVGNLNDGDTTNDATPKISGIAEPGSIVHLYVDGVENGSTTADASGNWTYTMTTLTDGQHTFTARAGDVAGNLGPVNTGITVMLDTSGVSVSITSVKDDVGTVTGDVAADNVTDDARPEFTGKAKAGSIITIKDGSTVLGSTTAGADGIWTFTPVGNLGDGAHSITATARDLSGQEDTSGAFTFRVDTATPNRPMIDYAEDQVGAVKNDLSNNGYTDDPQPILHGTAEANSIVRIYTADGTLIGSATASSSGAWNFKPGSKLPEGKNTFYVTATDEAGNVSDKSANFVVNTDYTSPDASKVSIDTVTDQYGVVQGLILDGGVLDDPRPVIGGTGAEQGNVITVYTTDKDGNTRVLGSTIVDANGKWTLTPSGSLYADSINHLSVVETDNVGNEAKPSGTYDVTLSNPPTAPVIDGVTDNTGPANVELNNGGMTSDTTPTLHGTAPGVAGNIVIIYNGNQVVGSTTLDASGHWTFTPLTALTDATYDFTVTVKNTAGQESEKSPSFSIEIDATAPAAVTDLTITDDVGTITGPLTNNAITDDNKPTFAGKAEPDSTVNILDNGVVIGSAAVDSYGNWTWTPATALADGAHQFTTTVTDSVGNTGAPTSPVNVTVDTQAPGVTLAIDGYLDDVGTNKGVIIGSGTSTDDTSPVLRGSWTGELKDTETLRIYQSGVLIGTVDPMDIDRNNHTWTLALSELQDGNTYTFTAAAVDAAGNESARSSDFTLTVDLTPPTQTVTINSYYDDVGLSTGNMSNGMTTDDRQPVLNGSLFGVPLAAGDEIRIYDAGTNTLLGVATMNPTSRRCRIIRPTPSGRWSRMPQVTKGRYPVSSRYRLICQSLSTARTPWIRHLSFPVTPALRLAPASMSRSR
ncbi:hypothetical protein GM30_02350 [Trabulsiella odontotermitis]|nr:hypothetical protein GM30_02350 [Trabulsiella odontotermitis]